MIIHQNDILGMVLAGGKNRRMGHEAKWQLPLANKPMIEHILERFSPQLDTIIINGSDTSLVQYQHTVVPDSFVGVTNESQGPLAGLLAGLEYAQAHGYSWLISCPCDSPFLPLDYVRQLVQTVNNTDQRCCIAASRGRMHPVFGLWSTQLITPLKNTLQHSDLRAIGYWAKQLQPTATIVHFDQHSTTEIDNFMNINTPAEWQYAETLYSRSTT